MSYLTWLTSLQDAGVMGNETESTRRAKGLSLGMRAFVDNLDVEEIVELHATARGFWCRRLGSSCSHQKTQSFGAVKAKRDAFTASHHS